MYPFVFCELFSSDLYRASSENIGFRDSMSDVGVGAGFSATCEHFPSVFTGIHSGPDLVFSWSFYLAHLVGRDRFILKRYHIISKLPVVISFQADRFILPKLTSCCETMQEQTEYKAMNLDQWSAFLRFCDEV